MAFSVWQATAQKSSGQVISEPLVTVLDGDGALAVLAVSAFGATMENPFIAAVNGYIRFFVAGGAYTIRADEQGTDEYVEWTDVLIGSAAGYDVGTRGDDLVTANTMGVGAGEVNWTGLNAQILTSGGVGTTNQFISLDTVTAGGIIAGSRLESKVFVNNGSFLIDRGSPTGTWSNLSNNSIMNGDLCILTKVGN